MHRSLVSAEHRQATHEYMSNVDINGKARSQTQAHELSGSLTPCEDAQNKRRHPDRSRTKKIVSVSQTALTALSEIHRSLVSAEVCMWLGPSHRQAKQNEKNSGVDGITYVL